MIEPNHVLPRAFLAQVDQNNKEKNEESPVALVIQGKYDPTHTLGPATHSLLLQIAKTHRLAIKIIDNGRDFGRKIREASTNFQKKASLLVILSHGTSGWLKFGEDTPRYRFWERGRPKYQKQDIVADDFAPLAQNATIVLLSCSSGQGLAQTVSNISQRLVFAPMGYIYDARTCLQNWPDSEIKILSYNEKDQQQMGIFVPDSLLTSIPPSDMLSEMNTKSFSEMAEYLRKKAEEGDADAQLKLGGFYLCGQGNCEKSDQKAFEWISSAAEKGHPRAQYVMGCYYLTGQGGIKQSADRAIQWFHRSASQDFPLALFQVGAFHYNGQCGFVQSDETAWEFFSRASKNGMPQADYYLGYMYEHGRGVCRSLKHAKNYYKRAQDNGITEAKSQLANLLFQEEQLLLNGNYFLNKIYVFATELLEQQQFWLKIEKLTPACIRARLRKASNLFAKILSPTYICGKPSAGISIETNPKYPLGERKSVNQIEIGYNRFLRKLEQLNRSQKEDAPIAMVIKAENDHNGMLSAAPAQSLLLQIARTHKVAIKTIEDACRFGTAISGSGANASLLVVMAHGYSDKIQFGFNTFWSRWLGNPFYHKNHITKEDFESLKPDAKIILYACATGQGIAQEIANLSNRIVYAPTGSLVDTKTCLQSWPDPDLKIVSYDENNGQHMRLFSPNSCSALVSMDQIFSEENKGSLSEMSTYLEEAALNGNGNAQWKLGIFYLFGIGNCQKSSQKGVHWLGLAAAQGEAQAQFELGNSHLSGTEGLERSEQRGVEWIALAAKQEHPSALFQMGIFSLNGGYGVQRSDEKAATFFKLALRKGVPQALFNLGVLYEFGRGVPHSLSYAHHLYEIADGLAIPGAKERLAALSYQMNR